MTKICKSFSKIFFQIFYFVKDIDKLIIVLIRNSVINIFFFKSLNNFRIVG